MKTLVIIDPQNDFITGKLGTKEAVKARDEIVKRLKNHDYDSVVITKDVHAGDSYGKTFEGKLFDSHCIKGSDGSIVDEKIGIALSSEVPMLGARKIVEKNSFMAPMYQMNLIDPFFNGGSFEFCGFCTDICVISNVLEFINYFGQSNEDIDISVNAKCCAGTTPENHKYALEIMKTCGAKIV